MIPCAFFTAFSIQNTCKSIEQLRNVDRFCNVPVHAGSACRPQEGFILCAEKRRLIYHIGIEPERIEKAIEGHTQLI